MEMAKQIIPECKHKIIDIHAGGTMAQAISSYWMLFHIHFSW